MNKFVKYGIEFIIFMAIFMYVDTRNGQGINWMMNSLFSLIIIVAQMMIDKRRKRYN